MLSATLLLRGGGTACVLDDSSLEVVYYTYIPAILTGLL